MKTYIALLRGINVGGHKKMPMVELRELFIKAGFENVETYIQSGNIIFHASKTNTTEIEIKIHLAILDHFNFDVPVIVKTRNELLSIFENCPFPQTEKENSYFILLSMVPDIELVLDVLNLTHENEEFVIINDCLYFYSSMGYGRTKFNMNTIEKKLNVSATSRNYKTMVKLLSLSDI